MAVVGTPLVLNGEIAGAAVAGYHLLEFPQSIAVERLAREAALPAARVWDVVRQETPISKPRVVAQGELLESRLQDFPESVAGDPSQLQQVAMNLLANAIKFTSPGGVVSVRLIQRDADAELSVADTARASNTSGNAGILHPRALRGGRGASAPCASP